MLSSVKTLGAAAVLAAFGLFAMSAVAEQASWLDQLSTQLETEKQCEVRFFTRVKDEKGDGGGYVEARAHCRDGRSFDASRQERFESFLLAECGTAVCSLTHAPNDWPTDKSG